MKTKCAKNFSTNKRFERKRQTGKPNDAHKTMTRTYCDEVVNHWSHLSLCNSGV